MKSFLRQYSDRFSTIIMIVIIIASVLFGVYPLYKKLMTLRIDHQKSEIAQDVLSDRVARFDEENKDVLIIKKNEQYIVQGITEDRIISLVEEIEEIADDIGVIVSFDVLDTEQVIAFKKERILKKEQKNSKEILPDSRYFIIKTRGTFSAITQFLQKIENHHLYLFLDHLLVVPYEQPKNYTNNIDSARISQAVQRGVGKSIVDNDDSDVSAHHVVMTALMRMPVKYDKDN